MNSRRWRGIIRRFGSVRRGGFTTVRRACAASANRSPRPRAFYNTVGFNDDTRAFLSIPARHDVARRIDCGFLARLVAEHRLDDWEAAELAVDLSYGLAKRAYRL